MSEDLVDLAIRHKARISELTLQIWSDLQSTLCPVGHLPRNMDVQYTDDGWRVTGCCEAFEAEAAKRLEGYEIP